MSMRDCEGGFLMMMMMRVGVRILLRVVDTTPSTTAETEEKYADWCRRQTSGIGG